MPTTAPRATKSKTAASKAAGPRSKRKSERVKRAFLFEVVVKADGAPEFKAGMGKGVLYSVEIGFNETPETYESPLFAAHLLERQEQIIREVIDCRISPITPA